MPGHYKTPEDMQEIYDEDAQKNAPKDKAIKATDKAHKAGNITDKEHIENLKKAPNLLGSRLLDDIGDKFTEFGSSVVEASQEDPDTWHDDAIRIGLGGVKNIGIVLSAPGIKQGLQLLGAPAYYVGRGLGYGLEKAGVDPRYGHIVGEVGEWFIPGYGMYKAAGKVSKYSKIVGSAAIADAAALMAKQNPMIASGAGTLPPGGNLKSAAERIQLSLKLRKTEITRQGKALLYALQHPVEKIPKLGRSTPEKVYSSIFLNKNKNPSIEDLELATQGPGFEGPGWEYIRPSKPGRPPGGGTSIANWQTIGKRLKELYGGTDEQIQSFIQKQIDAYKTTWDEIDFMNQRYPFEFLQFALSGVDGVPMGPKKFRMSHKQAENLAFDLYTRMVSNPTTAKLVELGHVTSAKNIARKVEPGVVTTADFVSNLRPEIIRSIRDFFKLDPKGPNFKAINNGTKVPKSSDYLLIEAGNRNRGARSDFMSLANLLMGHSPNVDLEYMRFLGDFGNAIDNVSVIPFSHQEHFTEYLRKGIKKWQKSEPGGLTGPYQLKFYRREMFRLIDDYLNRLKKGELRRAEIDAKSDIALDKIEGKAGEVDAINRSIIRDELPPGKDRNRRLYDK
tara:strand:- start:165 stop:2018 length:1854 start_codon:yes stop_codon:yes gene_type:complete